MRCQRDMSTFRYIFGHFFSKFSYNKIVMGKKIIVPCLDVMITFLPRNIQYLIHHNSNT